jgi:hypothetical protein
MRRNEQGVNTSGQYKNYDKSPNWLLLLNKQYLYQLVRPISGLYLLVFGPFGEKILYSLPMVGVIAWVYPNKVFSKNTKEKRVFPSGITREILVRI